MTDIHPMLESTARILYCVQEGIALESAEPGAINSAHVDYWFSHCEPHERELAEEYRSMARAALRSLLNVTGDVVEAGAQELFGHHLSDRRRRADLAFTAMISHILKDTPHDR